MSQVIETHDELKAKRDRSRVQEHNINREAAYSRWRRSDVTKQDRIAQAIGLLLVPLFGVWTVISWVAMEVLMQGIFRPLGGLIGGTRSLVTGAAAEAPAATAAPGVDPHK